MVARAHDNQASGAATSLARSDGLAIVPVSAEALDPAALIDFLRWNDL